MFDLYKNILNGVSGLNSALRIAISNADNFNTPGFKSTLASFVATPGVGAGGGTRTVNPMQFGGGMTVGSTFTDFSQGNITLGTSLDNAIVGEGFFVLAKSAIDSSGETEKVFTRNGHFQVDNKNQYLVDSFGRKLYGFKTDANGNVVDKTLVPIQTGGNLDIGFTDGGILVANFQKNKSDVAASAVNPAPTVPLYRVALTSFYNKQGLVLVDGGAYAATLSSGESLEYGSAGEGAYGSVIASKLESSNIDVAKVALNMALLNRGYAAIQGLIDNVNKITSGLISKLQ